MLEANFHIVASITEAAKDIHQSTTVFRRFIQSCDRLFFEGFEDLNRHQHIAKEVDKKLSYSKEICENLIKLINLFG